MKTLHYAFTDDYKADMHRHIDDLYSQAKTLDTDRQSRIDESDALVEAYFAHCGKVPDSAPLERLASLILREELTDSNPYKMRHEAEPILSENQYRRRTEGKHESRLGKDGKLRPLIREVPITLAENIGTDGRDYSFPNRRIIDVQEQMDIEYHGKRVDGGED